MDGVDGCEEKGPRKGVEWNDPVEVFVGFLPWVSRCFQANPEWTRSSILDFGCCSRQMFNLRRQIHPRLGHRRRPTEGCE